MKHVWKCPVCCKELVLLNCEWVKTKVVERGRNHSRKQPSVNLRIAAGFAVGVNMTKLRKFVTNKLAIKMTSFRNVLHQNTKIRGAVSSIFAGRLKENRLEHNVKTRSSNAYVGDVKWVHNGQARSTCSGKVSSDGAGCTRSYGGRGHKGAQTAQVNNSSETGNPVSLVHSQVSILHESLRVLLIFQSLSNRLTNSLCQDKMHQMHPCYQQAHSRARESNRRRRDRRSVLQLFYTSRRGMLPRQSLECKLRRGVSI